MRKKYTYESFGHYNQKKYYEHVGKDFKGRPVVIFNGSYVFQKDIKDEDEFLDYTFYMLDLHVQDLCEGYVD